MEGKLVNPGNPDNPDNPGDAVRRGALLLALVPAAVAFLVYAPSLTNGFVNWDDGIYVYANPSIMSLDAASIWGLFTTLETTTWNPVVLLSFAVDYQVWGLRPFGFHLTNTVGHAANSYLVFITVFILVQLTGSRNEDLTGYALTVSLVASILFATHPKHVESVVWISQRKDVLFLFFYLLTVITFLTYSRRSGHSWTLYGAALLFFALSLLSKTMAVSLPIVLLILDLYPLKREDFKYMVLEKIPFLILSALTSLLILMNLKSVAAHSVITTSAAERFYTSVRSYAYYVYKLAWPIDLVPFYPYPVGLGPFNPVVVASMVFLLAVTVACIFSLKRTRLYAALWAFYLITLLPVIGITQSGEHGGADRFTYMPAIAFFILVAVAAARLYESTEGLRRKAAIAAAVVVVALLSAKTVHQGRVWKDSSTLWTHQIRVYPDAAHPGYYLRAKEYAWLGRYRDAVVDYSKAIEIDPANPEIYFLRAAVRSRFNSMVGGTAEVTAEVIAEVIADYSNAIALDPEYKAAYINRGSAFLKSRRYKLAVSDLQRVLELDPADTRPYPGLVSAYSAMGRVDDAAYYLKLGREAARSRRK